MSAFLKTDLSNFQDIFRPPPEGMGLFLTFEGVEGSGKTTQISKLERHYREQGRRVECLREPGGTAFGEDLRALLLGQQGKDMLNALTETCVFLASRAQLLHEKVLPTLQDPRAVVILDRYIDSTLVYQGFARNRGTAALWALHQFTPLNLLPHATLFLDVDVETSFARQAARGLAKDYFEARDQGFHHTLADGYRRVANLHPERIQRIDAEDGEEQVAKRIMEFLSVKGWA